MRRNEHSELYEFRSRPLLACRPFTATGTVRFSNRVACETCDVDEHAQRMVKRFLDAVDEYRNGRISLVDLSRQARQVADTLDNASAPIPQLLEHVESELEYTYYASQSTEHLDRAEQILRPVLAEIAISDSSS